MQHVHNHLGRHCLIHECNVGVSPTCSTNFNSITTTLVLMLFITPTTTFSLIFKLFQTSQHTKQKKGISYIIKLDA